MSVGANDLELIYNELNQPNGKCNNCNNDVNTIEYSGEIICKWCLGSISVQTEMEDDYNNLFVNKKSITDVGINSSVKNSRLLMKSHNWARVPHKENKVYVFYNFILGLKDKISNNNYLQEISKKTCNIFQMLNDADKPFRNPIKTGILANCFYYMSKEYDIIYFSHELADLFGTTNDIITRSANRIIKILIKEPKLSKKINTTPLVLTDYKAYIRYKFPYFTVDDMNLIVKYLKRLEKHPLCISNEVKSILTGILINISRFDQFKKYNITIHKIKEVFGTSTSTITKYNNELFHMIY